MKILICCVCYNNPQDLIDYLESIKLSLSLTDDVQVSVSISNTGEVFSSSILEKLASYNEISVLTTSVHQGMGNIGYFPGLFFAYNQSYEANNNDYLIVSNVDLKLSSDFFSKFSEEREMLDGVVTAPSIYSEYEKKDRNPKMLTRLSSRHLDKYIFLYTVPFLHYLYKNTIYKLKSKNDSTICQGNIYAPHGSFIIFGCDSALWYEFLSYPIFLFGEEIYVGEISRKNKIPVVYEPNLIILDKDHASTSLKSESFLRKCNLKAMKYLKGKYWSENVR